MSRASALVGNDGGDAAHHRLPIGIGILGDQHFPGLHFLQFADFSDHMRPSAANFFADRLAGYRAALVCARQQADKPQRVA